MRAQAAGRPALLKTGKTNRRELLDRGFVVWGVLATVIGLGVLGALLVVLFRDGGDALDWEFLSSFASRRAEDAGVLAALVGSFLVILTTACIAIPLGVAAALYLEEYAPRNPLTDAIEIATNNLAGVPSIVYGLLALGLFVYQLQLGRSIATAGLTLALLILPIIIVATREAIRAVPHAIRDAALALGASKWEATKDHVLPAATPGMITGVIIGLSRALGETAPLITIGALTFVAFLPIQSPSDIQFVQVGRYDENLVLQNPGEIGVVNLPRGGLALLPSGEERSLEPGPAQLPTGTVVRTTVGVGAAAGSWAPWSWLNQSFTALPIQMFNWTSRPDAAFRANAAAAGLVLLALTLLMNGGAIWLRYRLRRAIRW